MTAEDRAVSTPIQNGFAPRPGRRKGRGWLTWTISFLGFLGLGGVLFYVGSSFYAGEDARGAGPL
ncbi:MAG TPA: hypothetical protein PK867_15360, partial [Pirellulales bacterium]|nr:hypothetical protein [Pirellulales bacterium]